jgi:hypothetical protein
MVGSRKKIVKRHLKAVSKVFADPTIPQETKEQLTQHLALYYQVARKWGYFNHSNSAFLFDYAQIKAGWIQRMVEGTDWNVDLVISLIRSPQKLTTIQQLLQQVEVDILLEALSELKNRPLSVIPDENLRVLIRLALPSYADLPIQWVLGLYELDGRRGINPAS